MASSLRVEFRNRLTAAMRARDRQTVGTMRSVLAALENAEAVPVTHETRVGPSVHVAGAADGLGAGEAPRRSLTPDDERAVVERELAELRASSAVLADAGEHERSAELARLAETVEEVLKAEG